MSLGTARADQQRLLPIMVEDRLVAWTGRVVGLALLVLVGLMWACLVTWSSADPSLTHTTAGKTQNFMGSAGAVVSDLLLQTLGLATVLILLPPMIWGLELIKIGRVPGFGTKVSFFPLAVLILAGALSGVPAFGNWPMANGFGGILGDLFFSFGAGILAALSPDRAALATAILLSGLGFSALAGSMGLRSHELLGLLWNVRPSHRMREIAGTWQQSLWAEAKKLAHDMSAQHPQAPMWSQPPTAVPPMMTPSFERAASSDAVPGAIEPTLPDPHGVLRAKSTPAEVKPELPVAPQAPTPAVQAAPPPPSPPQAAPVVASEPILPIEPLPLVPSAERAAAPAPAKAPPASPVERARSPDPEPAGDEDEDDLTSDLALDDDEDDGSLAIARRFAPANPQIRALAKRKAAEQHEPVRSAPPAKPAPAKASKPAFLNASTAKPAPAKAAPAKPSAAKPLKGLAAPPKSAAPARPSLNLLEPQRSEKLAPVAGQAIKERSVKLIEVLALYGVNGEIRTTTAGPVVSLFEFEPTRGVKAARVISLADDVARCMGVASARIAVLPGRSALAIELPNARREAVQLRHILESHAFRNADGALPFALGRSIAGDPVVVDLAGMPSLVIAGTPNRGKSEALHAILLSLLYRHSAEDLQLMLIDPRRSDLVAYDGIPHLVAPVAVEADKIAAAVAWLRGELEERQKRLSRLGARSVDIYNRRVRNAKVRGERFERVVQTGFDRASGAALYERQLIDAEPMADIVVVISELAALAAPAAKEAEALLRAISPVARTVGIHMVLATETPEAITPAIKSCGPACLGLKLSTRAESRALLGEEGAEQLLDRGDMLYASGSGHVLRIHAPAVSTREVEGIARFLRSEMAPKLAS